MCRYHHLEEAFRLFDKIGAIYSYDVQKSNVIRIEVVFNNKKRCMFTSKTPSDGNAIHQVKRDARNLIMKMQR